MRSIRNSQLIPIEQIGNLFDKTQRIANNEHIYYIHIYNIHISLVENYPMRSMHIK